VKDVWETAGLVTTSGATKFRRHVPATDALAVARLRQAGAIIFGKTNTRAYAGDWRTQPSRKPGCRSPSPTAWRLG